MTFIEGGYATQNVTNKRNDEWYLIIFTVIGMKNNQTMVADADREIPTLVSTDNAGNLIRFTKFPSLSIDRFYLPLFCLSQVKQK